MKYSLPLVIFLLLFSLSACISKPTPDAQTDAALGLDAEDEVEDAEKTLQKIQEKQLQEQKRQMERQITDPLSQ